jgi:hypothetical protein
MSKRSPFPAKDVQKLVRHLEDHQGCKVKPKAAGYWVGFPNGESTTIHLSLSDTRAIKNVKACVVRNGCVWPL